jgi:hypothetical protein
MPTVVRVEWHTCASLHSACTCGVTARADIFHAVQHAAITQRVHQNGYINVFLYAVEQVVICLNSDGESARTSLFRFFTEC